MKIPVHPVPVNLPVVSADQAELHSDELVIGVEQNGQAMAFPVRYMALFEVVNDQVGDLPVAPTW